MSHTICNKEFWKCAAIRAAKTFLQAVIGAWTAGQMITDLPWKVIFITALSAAIYSLLTSIWAGLPEVDQKEALILIAEDRGEPITDGDEEPEED